MAGRPPADLSRAFVVPPNHAVRDLRTAADKFAPAELRIRCNASYNYIFSFQLRSSGAVAFSSAASPLTLMMTGPKPGSRPSPSRAEYIHRVFRPRRAARRHVLEHFSRRKNEGDYFRIIVLYGFGDCLRSEDRLCPLPALPRTP